MHYVIFQHVEVPNIFRPDDRITATLQVATFKSYWRAWLFRLWYHFLSREDFFYRVRWDIWPVHQDSIG